MTQADYEQLESSQRRHDQYMKHCEEMCNLQEIKIAEFVAALKPRFSKDGNRYCFLFGEDIQEGIAGFGETPYKAATDLYNAFMNETIREGTGNSVPDTGEETAKQGKEKQ